MIKKKGSLLVENIMAISILLMVILGIVKIIQYNSKWIEIRNKEDEINRTLYSVEQEFKYNLSIEEILNLSKNNKIFIDEDDLLNKLKTIDIENFIGDGNIQVEILEIYHNRLNIKISLNYNECGEEINATRKFIKPEVINE